MYFASNSKAMDMEREREGSWMKLDEVGRDCAGLLRSLEEIHKYPKV